MINMGLTLIKLENLEKKLNLLLSERDKFRLEAKNERELSQSIVEEREQLYITVELLQKKNELLLNAIKNAHQSLTWCNTENQIPHAVWYLEQVLPQAIESNEPPSHGVTEAEAFGNDCKNGQCS